MPIFVDYKRKHFVYTSYKVAYSTLMSAQNSDLKYLHHEIDFTIFKHLIKHFYFQRYQLTRHPYDRFLSLFKDKYRMEPKKIQNPDFKWQPIHYLLLPYLGLNKSATDTNIARAFLNMDINDFVQLLPKIYLLDGHIAPQKHASALKISDARYISLRVDKYFKIESDKDEISQFTGIDFNQKRNVTNSSNLFNEFNSSSLSILQKLYKEDFNLGNYN